VQGIFSRVSFIGAIAVTLAFASHAGAQATASDTGRTELLPPRCASYVPPQASISDSARAAARDIASRAQAASIVGDNATATTLYQQAEQLNPSDASVAYALGREYEAAHDARGMGAYCRFLALSPGAPEAADVRQRIAEMALALPPDTTVLRVQVPVRPYMPSAGAAFGSGILFPGLGQFITRQPGVGFLVLVATAASAVYGAQSTTVSKVVTSTATDPFGNPYTFQTTVKTTERQHAAVGFGIAAAVWLTGAIQAAVHASGENAAAPATDAADSRPSRSAAPVILALDRRSVGFGFSIH